MKKNTCVLVVDDDAVVLQLFSEVLHKEGYEVWTAGTGQEGLQTARDRRPDVVLLDVMLPDVSGVEVCRRIKADAELTDVFVVLVSGEAKSASHKVGGLEAGADDYLEKPLGPDELVARIRTVVRLRNTTVALRESEGRKSAIMEAAPEGIVTLDHEGKIIEFNPAAERIFGHARAKVLGQEIAAGFITPALRNWFLRGLACLFAGGEGPILDTRIEMTGTRADGSDFPMEFTITRVALDGPPVFTAFIRDITHRKQIEAHLTMLAHAVESIAEPICISDLQYHVRFVNPAYQKNYGYTEAEVLGKDSTIYFSPANSPSLLAQIREQTSLGGWRGEVIARRKDGSELPISLSTSQIKDAHGQVIGLMCAAQDITQRKQAEARSAAFSSLGKQLSAASTSKEAAQIIVNVADALFGWDSCHVRLYAPEHDQIVPILAFDMIGSQRTELALDSLSLDPTPMTRHVMQHGAQLVNQDTPIPSEAPLTPFGNRSRQSASRMFVPMRRGENLLGILSIQSYRAHAYTQDDLRLLEGLADHCGGALERIKITESLRESEQRFRSLFEFAPIGIALHDANGHYMYTNRVYREMLGYSEAELKQSGIKRVTYPEDITEGQRLFGELRDGTRDFYRREKRYLRKDGRQVWAESSASAVRDHQGRLCYIVSMVDDITERKRAEKESLAFSQLGYRLNVATTPEEAAKIIMEIASDLFNWDAGYFHLYSQEEDKITRVLSLDIVDGQRVPTGPPRSTFDPSPLMRFVMNEGAQLIDFENESSIPVKMAPFGDTSRRSASRIYAPIRSAGRVVGILSIQSYTPKAFSRADLRLLQTLADHSGDALQRIKVGEALREAEVKYRSIVESSDDAIISRTIEGLIVSWNKAAERIYGYTAAEAIGQPILTLIPSDRADEFRQFTETLKRGGRIENFETIRRRKDGTFINVSTTVSPIKDRAGRITGASAIARDVTLRKRLEKEILEVNDRHQRRMGEDIHDGLCQLLVSVAMNCNLLMQGLAAQSHPETENAEKILTQVNLAIAEARGLAHGLSPLNLVRNDLAAALQDFALRTSRDFHVHCVAECATPVPVNNPALATHLYRIAREAVHNAVKHAQPSRITIRLAAEADTACLSISDDGIGIQENYGQNSGMGLNLMKHRAAMIGGELRIEQSSPGGTIISCNFPVTMFSFVAGSEGYDPEKSRRQDSRGSC